MKKYDISKIRNVVFLGQSGAGKTQLISTILFNAKAISRFCTVDEGNTPLDYNPIEIEKRFQLIQN
jgi:elongation factor G